MLYYVGLIAVVAFSVTGVIAAGKKDMDIFSIVLLGVVTALGGGTLRDIILDANPIFWIADTTYFWVSLVASIVAFFGVRVVTRLLKLFEYADALGLSLFTILAMEKSFNLGFGYTTAVVMGIITGIVGGVVRDILTGRTPLVMGREFYATPALIGAVFFAVAMCCFPTFGGSKYFAMCIIFVLRVCAIRWGLYYPRWLTYKTYQDS
ncbi:trimeric intracellular cation channel family protein [Desulfogranum japonicum]|uniref:trimeric intracellular cation channel family protein n=1 Tax=Desulfogranum japonicum TaxID=231447 RepID=UPI0003F770CB|nr:trimeric intracellular cation channel family protein [Desulfogranum japonicum]